MCDFLTIITYEKSVNLNYNYKNNISLNTKYHGYSKLSPIVNMVAILDDEIKMIKINK